MDRRALNSNIGDVYARAPRSEAVIVSEWICIYAEKYVYMGRAGEMKLRGPTCMKEDDGGWNKKGGRGAVSWRLECVWVETERWVRPSKSAWIAGAEREDGCTQWPPRNVKQVLNLNSLFTGRPGGNCL